MTPKRVLNSCPAS